MQQMHDLSEVEKRCERTILQMQHLSEVLKGYYKRPQRNDLGEVKPL